MLKKLNAFSLVEMLITLVVVSVLLSAFVPVITKKMTKNIEVHSSSGGSGGASAPTGTIVLYLGQTPPEGWLLCDGAEYSASTYPNLAAHLGADGEGKYKTPNMKGYVPKGATNSDIARANTN